MLKEGWLYKQGQMRRNWKRRYFVLQPSAVAAAEGAAGAGPGAPPFARIKYYDAAPTAPKRKQLGELQFGLDAKIELLPENARKKGSSAASEWRFAITGSSPRRLLMAAPDHAGMIAWAEAVRAAAAAQMPGKAAAKAANLVATAAATPGAEAAATAKAAAAKAKAAAEGSRLSPDDFLFGGTLGEGAYARVVVAQLKATGERYAVKVCSCLRRAARVLLCKKAHTRDPVAVSGDSRRCYLRAERASGQDSLCGGCVLKPKAAFEAPDYSNGTSLGLRARENFSFSSK